MSLIVRALQIYTPEYVKKRALKELFIFSAEAFQAEVPAIAGLDSRACLAEYARFTQAQAERWLQEGRHVEVVAQHLYRNAVEMGRLHGRLLRLNTVKDVMAIGQVLYRILDIDFHGDERGQVVIGRCYFSRFYSPEVCRLMSAMDRGLFAGLSNGGELTFTSRITEGQAYCRAHFDSGPMAAHRPVED
ncbi:MAG: hypothetical protein ACM3JD_08390 [Rudaea sp.]